MANHLRAVALQLLARRDHSQHDLAQKLIAKGFLTQEINILISELVQEGLINEQRFVENYIQWRGTKGYGPQRISMELQARGITAEMIAEHLQITDNAWFNEARKLWQKRFKNKFPRDFKSKVKQMRFLQYRGFTREQIDSIFKDTYGNSNDE